MHPCRSYRVALCNPAATKQLILSSAPFVSQTGPGLCLCLSSWFCHHQSELSGGGGRDKEERCGQRWVM